MRTSLGNSHSRVFSAKRKEREQHSEGRQLGDDQVAGRKKRKKKTGKANFSKRLSYEQSKETPSTFTRLFSKKMSGIGTFYVFFLEIHGGACEGKIPFIMPPPPSPFPPKTFSVVTDLLHANSCCKQKWQGLGGLVYWSGLQQRVDPEGQTSRAAEGASQQSNHCDFIHRACSGSAFSSGWHSQHRKLPAVNIHLLRKEKHSAFFLFPTSTLMDVAL